MFTQEEEIRYQKGLNEINHGISEGIKRNQQNKINADIKKNRKIPVINKSWDKTYLNQSRCYVDNNTITSDMIDREVEMGFNLYDNF